MISSINQAVMDRFKRLLRANRLGHAYLFVGPSLVGKTQTAMAIAQMVNCQSSLELAPCGQCDQCQRIKAGTYLDVSLTKPDEKNSIKIEVVRHLLERFRLRAYEAKVKVFVICNVEWMEQEAANAFLKTLEEPAPNTLIILTTAVPEANLDTIKSRCHLVQFFPASFNRITKELGKEAGSLEEAAFLGQFSDGCLGRALKLSEDGVYERKNIILDRMLKAGAIDDLIKEISADKEAATEMLNILLSFFRDVLVFKTGVQEGFVHVDRLDDIRLHASRSVEDLAGVIQQIVKLKKLIDDNLNIKMALVLLKERIR